MNRIILKILFFQAIVVFFSSCEEVAIPYYDEQEPGKIVIRGLSVTDSIQITANDELLEIDDEDTFKGVIQKDYEFVYYNNANEVLKIIDKQTQTTIGTYTFTTAKPTDTLAFFYKPGIFIDNVYASKPGVLSKQGNTGYKFIFPNLNSYSQSGYDGPIDGIIRNTAGQVLGVAQNITKDNFSTFVEFSFAAPPILKMELVKHGTTESYITGKQVIVTLIMQNNKSQMIVLEEKHDANNVFSGVEGTINLGDFFEF